MPEFRFVCECGSIKFEIFEWRPYNTNESPSVLFQCSDCGRCYEQIDNKVVSAEIFG